MADYKPSSSAESVSVQAAGPGLLRFVMLREWAGLRVDQALVRALPDYSRARLQRWIESGLVQIDGRAVKPKAKILGGEEVVVNAQPEPSLSADQAQAIALDIVYEDEAIMVINKVPGMVVHPGHGNWSGTLLNALLEHVPQARELPRAGIVHRLDKDTGGLLVVAKTLAAHTKLVRQMQAREVKREYLAVVHGRPPASGSIDQPIGRHPVQRTKMAVVASGRAALTHYRVLEQFTHHALLCLTLHTGRTHQIRVHMASHGYPLLGDPTYGGGRRERRSEVNFARQALHAARLGLAHPITAKLMQWEAPLPGDMAELLRQLRGGSTP